jgi:RimJ/RimL family protein N-acetyltransferase
MAAGAARVKDKALAQMEEQYTMNFWQSERIRLRALEPCDAAIFFEWNQDSERARCVDFLWPPQSLTSVEAWVSEQSLKRLEGDRYFWVIETLDGTPVGSIDTHSCDARAGTFSYGIAIGSEHRRRGYAGEAVRLVLRYYFEELRYQKCTVSVHSFNTASARLHEHLGFTLEGTHRRMGYSEGRYFDVHWYGITLEEFRANLADA